MTVFQLIKKLQEFHGDKEVRFAAKPYDSMVILSIYSVDSGMSLDENFVWVDLGPEFHENFHS